MYFRQVAVPSPSNRPPVEACLIVEGARNFPRPITVRAGRISFSMPGVFLFVDIRRLNDTTAFSYVRLELEIFAEAKKQLFNLASESPSASLFRNPGWKYHSGGEMHFLTNAEIFGSSPAYRTSVGAVKISPRIEKGALPR